MNHKQHCTNSWFWLNRAQRMPALLSRFVVDPVPHKAVWVLESQARQFERDTALLPPIAQICCSDSSSHPIRNTRCIYEV